MYLMAGCESNIYIYKKKEKQQQRNLAKSWSKERPPPSQLPPPPPPVRLKDKTATPAANTSNKHYHQNTSNKHYHQFKHKQQTLPPNTSNKHYYQTPATNTTTKHQQQTLLPTKHQQQTLPPTQHREDWLTGRTLPHPEDGRRLQHLGHEGGHALQLAVAGPHSGQYAVHHADLRLRARHVAPQLCHQHHHPHLRQSPTVVTMNIMSCGS